MKLLLAGLHLQSVHIVLVWGRRLHIYFCHPQSGHHFSDSIDIKDVFRDYVNVVEFLISSGHLRPHKGTARQARHDNNNNNIKSHIYLTNHQMKLTK